MSVMIALRQMKASIAELEAAAKSREDRARVARIRAGIFALDEAHAYILGSIGEEVDAEHDENGHLSPLGRKIVRILERAQKSAEKLRGSVS